MGPLREVCDDLSEALGDVERNLLRHDRKIESVRVSHDTHLSTLESSLLQLEERHRRDRDILEDHAILLPHGRQVSGYIQTALCYATQLSRKAYNVILPYVPFDISPKSSAPSGLVRHSVDVSLDPPCRNGSNKSPVLFTTRLETIPEAEDSDSDGTYVSGEEVPVETSPTRQLKTTLKRSRSISPLRRGATSIGGFVYSVAVWPYHVTARLFWLFFSPVQKILL
ncbi:hypothetical protein QCA50_016168 [Cerrena zonata]|uniref:Uncharacterized protein n=1 Tax=Cerrena zonata TaxID=2478898 RepID=A0AAW0FGL1_9APHY